MTASEWLSYPLASPRSKCLTNRSLVFREERATYKTSSSSDGTATTGGRTAAGRIVGSALNSWP